MNRYEIEIGNGLPPLMMEAETMDEAAIRALRSLSTERVSVRLADSDEEWTDYSAQ